MRLAVEYAAVDQYWPKAIAIGQSQRAMVAAKVAKLSTDPDVLRRAERETGLPYGRI